MNISIIETQGAKQKIVTNEARETEAGPCQTFQVLLRRLEARLIAMGSYCRFKARRDISPIPVDRAAV